MAFRNSPLAAFAFHAFVVFTPTMLPMVQANAFLGRMEDSREAPDPEFQRHILEELEVMLGSEHRAFTEKRLQRIEKDLRPIFTAMPKNDDGSLEHAAISYMLHRAFVQRHGWQVRSLSGEGRSMSEWNTSSAANAVLDNHVSEDVIGAFEKRLGNHGTGLHEVAVLAATLEHLAHKEALGRLRVAYDTWNFQADDVISSEESDNVVQAYMAVYILGGYMTALSNTTTLSGSKVRHLLKHIENIYPTWKETLKFALEVKQRVAPKRDYLYFADIANAIEEFGEHFGEFQDRECLSMKDQLLKVEQPGAPGRVRLADFYKLAKEASEGLFSESKNYLREMGALDESDPANPRVLVSNYINGPSNCIASSNYYSVCCRDECENLLSHLELQLQKSEAKPAQLAGLVAALPSRTEPANRTLSPWLLSRLDEVAAHHGGVVPLHGRLFAQWMHYAYPRECTYPHVAGAVKAQRMEDFLSSGNAKESINDIVASAEEMDEHIEATLNVTTAEDSDISMWTLEEELLVTRPEMAPSMSMDQPGSIMAGVRGAAFLAAAFSVSFGLMRTMKESRGLCSPSFPAHEKYMV
jgi:hypothetical protein